MVKSSFNYIILFAMMKLGNSHAGVLVKGKRSKNNFLISMFSRLNFNAHWHFMPLGIMSLLNHDFTAYSMSSPPWCATH